LLTCAPLLHAQDAPYRPALAQLRAALDSEGTPIGIDRVAQQWDTTAAQPTRRLGNGYIELRRGMVANDNRMLQSTWDAFDRIVQVHPDWPYALMGLAITALEIERRGYKVPGIYDGSPGLTHYEGAAKQFARLLEMEPDFEPALVWIANSLLTEEGDRAQPEVLMQAIATAIDSNKGTDPRLQLIVARALRLEGNAPESVRRINLYLRQGGDSGVATSSWPGRSPPWTRSPGVRASISQERTSRRRRRVPSTGWICPGSPRRSNSQPSTRCQPIPSVPSSPGSGPSATRENSGRPGAGCRNTCVAGST
jgi:hypothetical protein